MIINVIKYTCLISRLSAQIMYRLSAIHYIQKMTLSQLNRNQALSRKKNKQSGSQPHITYTDSQPVLHIQYMYIKYDRVALRRALNVTSTVKFKPTG